MGTWQYTLFTSWVMPLLGQSQACTRGTTSACGDLILFTIIHVYLVFREDIASRENRDQHDGQRLGRTKA